LKEEEKGTRVIVKKLQRVFSLRGGLAWSTPREGPFQTNQKEVWPKKTNIPRNSRIFQGRIKGRGEKS